jgi:tRNA nucleotidyltransferase (CCA-adding enzyme)
VTIDIKKPIITIINILERNGFEAFIVGGCVRDSLLNKKPHDWDITTNALPEQVISCFKGYKVIETGLKHGTVTVMLDGEPYEITTYRVDGKYSDNRHPDSVRFVSSLKADLSRRDFTVNAMAYSPSVGLIDYFGGQEDLKNKLIKCVGEPDKRFQEDALRIMRAVRFDKSLGMIDETIN